MTDCDYCQETIKGKVYKNELGDPMCRACYRGRPKPKDTENEVLGPGW
jgi:hypothetical protein